MPAQKTYKSRPAQSCKPASAVVNPTLFFEAIWWNMEAIWNLNPTLIVEAIKCELHWNVDMSSGGYGDIV